MSQSRVIVSEKPTPRHFVEVTKGPILEINDNQVLFKAVAFAANPTDWKHAAYGWGQPGSVAGSDASGIVIKVGKNVRHIAEGDYVSAIIHGNISEYGAFSEYVVSEGPATFKYDKSTITDKKLSVGTHPAGPIDSFEAAASVTLSLATICVSYSNQLKLSYNKSENADKYILIWGGASAAGIFGIQVAKLIYGLKVVVTASKANHELLKSLGADEVFDYKDSDVIEQIKKAAGGKISYALDTVAIPETYQQTYDASEGDYDVVFDNLQSLTESSIKTKPGRKATFHGTSGYVVDGKTHKVAGHTFKGDDQLYKNFNHIWQKVLPEYISQIKTPRLKVLKPGLESANEALSLINEGQISGEKIVFHI